MAAQPVDYINLRNIRFPFPLIVDPDAWGRPNKPQPAILSLRVAFPRSLINEAARNDHVRTTLNYSALYKTLEGNIRGAIARAVDPQSGAPKGLGLAGLADLIESSVDTERYDQLSSSGMALGPFMTAEMILHLPKAVLRAAGGLRCLTRTNVSGESEREFRIEDIRCYCIIGVNEHERLEKQAVDVALIFKCVASDTVRTAAFAQTYPQITKKAAEFVDSSSFETVEALATEVARLVIIDFGWGEVTVKVDKPSALAFVEHSGVEMTRTASFFGE
ncbi:dihydroneopterin aldolase family protein [Coccidioides posadasii C735 delta SOWgp]|uniref:dihydroneopterin aldolase n=1 Tax=Coccidioides posadasii (strain C735) TaxID=222929 RepID=C5P9W2_COCP7|nr:dihydroneopterin aldolase family protein [Coccidioides posadasii C735 delta SOWgp]EER26524.1 dihydroneopterin aldolase family protein [Coccidioides posadasii C735 delta SOWgp]|eukprot:XP_003068669.1 dihydroneopterin aldolase family protein [Coccidioides posadasii C735 delta SOWgp]